MRPLTLWSDIPPLNREFEVHRLDAKDGKAYDRLADPDFERAKDMAAMANAFGGTLLIGAVTHGSLITRILGISTDEAREHVKQFENALKRCKPSPRMEPNLIESPDKSILVLAINTWPAVDGIVGARNGDEKEPRFWTFPVRSGSHTRWLDPDQFASIESVSARRAASLLSMIGAADKVAVTASTAVHPAPRYRGTLTELSLENNRATFQVERVGAGPTKSQELSVPLDFIGTVWREADSEWKITLTCHIESSGGRYTPTPYLGI